MTNPPIRPSVSTDKLIAVQAPPTEIREGNMVLDPKKVIKAWAESAEVLRECVDAINVNLQDNECTREITLQSQHAIVTTGRRVLIIQLVAASIVFATSLWTLREVSETRKDCSSQAP